MDQTVIIWDLAAQEDSEAEAAEAAEEKIIDRDDGKPIVPELLFQHRGHHGGIADFSWAPLDRNLLCSVDDDGALQIWQNQCSFDYLSDVEGSLGGYRGMRTSA